MLIGLLLVACGDETAPTPALATATAEGPAPSNPGATAGPTFTPVTLGLPPATPAPPTPAPTATASQALLTNNYVSQATSIVTGIINAPEISDALTASGEAATNALFGGNVDTNALSAKLDKAATVVSDAGDKFAALNPPDQYKPTHQKLVDVFSRYSKDFTTAENAVNSGDWGSLASAAADIASASSDLSTLLGQLNAAP